MEFTTTECGTRKLLKDGYIYLFKKDLANEFTSWECKLRRKGGCRASVKLDKLDNFVEQVNEHSHPHSARKCETIKIKESIRRRARDSLDNPREIVSEEVQNVSETVAVNLPSLNHLGRYCHPNGVVREALPQLPPEYQVTSAGERSLIHDSGIGDEKRILIFGSPDTLQLLRESPYWFGDGTFKVCPIIFSQVYTLHGLVQDRIIPCIYALLPDKSENIYRRFFEEVRNTLDLEHSPQDIMIDFEIGAINAAAATFEGKEMKGCFFHLCSKLWKQIQRSGLQQRYIDDAEFDNTLRMIAALAFVLPDEVEDYFE